MNTTETDEKDSAEAWSGNLRDMLHLGKLGVALSRPLCSNREVQSSLFLALNHGELQRNPWSYAGVKPLERKQGMGLGKSSKLPVPVIRSFMQVLG